MLRMLKRLIDGDEKLKLAVGQILAGNADGLASAVAPLGDVTLGSAGSMIIGATKVTSAMLAASAVGVTKLKYTNVSITVLVSAASTTSTWAAVAANAGYKLLGIWLTTTVSDVSSFTWKVTEGSNSVRVDINALTGLNTLVWKGVVIEP